MAGKGVRSERALAHQCPRGEHVPNALVKSTVLCKCPGVNYRLVLQSFLVCGNLSSREPTPTGKSTTGRVVQSKVVTISDACDLAHKASAAQETRADVDRLRDSSKVGLVKFEETEGSGRQDERGYDCLRLGKG